MQVKCRCGQHYSTFEPRFPHRVHCHMCGVRFMVLQDGSTNEIRAISVSVNCRCGHPYTINSLQFPRTIHCIACHHHFSVLDTGEIIDADVELESAITLHSAVAQADEPSEWNAPADTAFQEGLPQETRFTNREATVALATADGLGDDRSEELFALHLAAFDAKWQQQRLRYLVTCYQWLQFYPSRLICLGIFITYVPMAVLTALLFFDAFDVSVSAIWWILLVAMNASIYLFAHLFQRAALYDAAENRWQMERGAMIRSHNARLTYQREIGSSDSDDIAY